MTRLFRLDPEDPVRFPPEVAGSLRAGGLVIFPTDTLYGLGASPGSEEGLARLLSAKGREEGKPVPLLLDGPGRVSSLARSIPAEASRLMERFWPGALTVVLPAASGLPDAVTGGTGTVGVRVPAHPVPRAIAAAAGGAVTGTSANRAGKPAAWRTGEEIVNEFAGLVDWVLWNGPSPPSPGGGDFPGPSPGSTVVLVEQGKVLLLREGVILFRHITDFLGEG